MNILLLGSGGREHSLALKISESGQLSRLFVAPGNPGTASVATNVAISATDIASLLAFVVKEEIDLTVVGPEAPLALGIVDAFESEGHAIIGPCMEAAKLESSKSWSKSVMKDARIPTADYHVFDEFEIAVSYLKTAVFPLVVKADGLAAGKGVTVCQNYEQAETAVRECMVDQVFQSAGAQVVIESFLEGEEASILAFCDGKTIVPMVSAQDHKPIFDGDKGPNTGGMGAYSPAPIVTTGVLQKVQDQIFNPLLTHFHKMGVPLKGIIYAGLMIKDGDPYVVEFNMRFGDPETQAVLPRLKTDILSIFSAMVSGTLSDQLIEWHPTVTVCVVLASDGYPGSYDTGKKIMGLDTVSSDVDLAIHAGTIERDGTLFTNGGRVLGIVGIDTTIQGAIDRVYNSVEKVSFEGMQYRTDIGRKSLNA